MPHLRKHIVKVIAYFGLFNYPVTYEEIKFFLGQAFNEGELLAELHTLIDSGIVYRLNGFYSLQKNYAFVEKRVAGNAAAESKLKLAARLARFLIRFPYIRGVAVSGSLSKNFAYKGSDIDFFIVAQPGRLWVARMFFMCFYHLVKLVGLKNWFCLNYFIDSEALEIPEKNIYTAIEIATLMPKQGKAVFEEFYRKNNWVYNYLPNYAPQNEGTVESKPGFVKSTVEWLFNGRLGNSIEDFLCRFYRERWRKMLEKKQYAKNGFQFGSYIAGTHVCKPMPQYFQGKLLARLDEELKELDKVLATPKPIAV